MTYTFIQTWVFVGVCEMIVFKYNSNLPLCLQQ